jgi:deazaflavin-dependent oxidoreductase (nitroreductase family)
MANPFAKSRMFHRIGHVTNTPPWRVLPTPAGLALVTTTGRKTGKPRKRAMRVVRDGDRAYAVSLLGGGADWVRNLRANPNAQVKLGGTTYTAIGRVLTDSGERARAADLYRPIAGWYDWLDYANFVWSVPTRGRLLRVHDEWFEGGTPVVFELQAPA